MTQIYSYEKIRNDMRLLELLSQSVPNIGAACTEIINLEAILNLPKGTEHFLAGHTRGIRGLPAYLEKTRRAISNVR